MNEKPANGFRVAHIQRDSSGNFHYREGLWIPELMPHSCGKDEIAVVYDDDGKAHRVKSREVKLLGVANGQRIRVMHVSPESNVRRCGWLFAEIQGNESERVEVLFDGDGETTSVPVQSLSILGTAEAGE